MWILSKGWADPVIARAAGRVGFAACRTCPMPAAAARETRVRMEPRADGGGSDAVALFEEWRHGRAARDPHTPADFGVFLQLIREADRRCRCDLDAVRAAIEATDGQQREDEAVFQLPPDERALRLAVLIPASAEVGDAGAAAAAAGRHPARITGQASAWRFPVRRR